MSKNPLILRKEQNKKTLNFWLTIPAPELSEEISKYGYHALTLDNQHGTFDYQTSLSCLQSMSGSNITPLIRPRSNSQDEIMKILDAGAMGVIVPLIRNAEDVKNMLDGCYYPPYGNRSYASSVRAIVNYDGDYLEDCNDLMLPLAMIETAQAYDCLDKILEVERLKGIYLGPSDLALSFGYKPDPRLENQLMQKKVDDLLELAKSRGAYTAIHCGSFAIAKRYLDLGFDFATVGTVMGLFKIGFNSQHENIKKYL